MQIPRHLIYEEKSLDFFKIDDENSIFSAFTCALLHINGRRTSNPGIETTITSMFNDACYICTLAMSVEYPYLYYGDYRAYISDMNSSRKAYMARTDIVMLMVMCLFENTIGLPDNVRRLSTIIDKDVNIESSSVAKILYHYMKDKKWNIDGSFFSKRIPTKEFLDSQNWFLLTKQFNIDEIEKVVNYWTIPKEQIMVIDSIEKQVIEKDRKQISFLSF